MTAAIFATALVVLAVLVIVLVSVTGKTTPSKAGFGMKPAPAAVVNAISLPVNATVETLEILPTIGIL